MNLVTGPAVQLPTIIVNAFENLQTSQYIQVAATAILAYDYPILLNDEIRHIWRGQRNSAAVAFLLTRYCPFVEAALLIAQQFSTNPSQNSCSRLTTAGAWLYLLGIAISHSILVLRTYVICDKNKLLAVFFSALLVLAFAGGAYLTPRFLNSLVFIPSPSALEFPGCFVAAANGDIFWISSSFAAAYELVIMLITWYKVVHKGKHRGSLLMRTLTWDGLSFYGYMFITSVVNIILLNLAPAALQIQLIFLQRFLHAMISCRIIIRLRRVADGDQGQNVKQLARPPTLLARIPAETSAEEEFELKQFPRTIA